jgi:hypothetical protein
MVFCLAGRLVSFGRSGQRKSAVSRHSWRFIAFAQQKRCGSKRIDFAFRYGKAAFALR